MEYLQLLESGEGGSGRKGGGRRGAWQSRSYSVIKTPSSPHHRHMRRVYGDSPRKLGYFSPRIFDCGAVKGRRRGADHTKRIGER